MKKSTPSGAIVALSLLATLAHASSALADTTPSTSVTTPSAAGAASKWDNVSIGYLGQWFGPSVGNINSQAGNPDGTGGPTQFIRSLVAVNYKFDKQTSVGVNINWDYRFLHGQDLKPIDPELKFMKKYTSGTLTFAPELRMSLPITTASSLNRITRFRSFNTLTYDVPRTKLTLGAYLILYGVVHGKGGATGGDYDGYIYAAPTLNYQFNKVVAATLAYELNTRKNPGDSITDWKADGSDIQLGANFTVGKGIDINPYLQWTPTESFNEKTVSYGAYLSAKLL